MRHVHTAQQSLPHAVKHLLSAQASPAACEISFVAHLVQHHRLAINIIKYRGAPGLFHRSFILDAGVREFVHPIREVSCSTAMYETEMSVRVCCTDCTDERYPVGLRLGLHVVILIGKRPPHVSERRKPRTDITDISHVGLHRETIKSPAAFVIRMKKDKISLNTKRIQGIDLPLQMAEERGVEA